MNQETNNLLAIVSTVNAGTLTDFISSLKTLIVHAATTLPTPLPQKELLIDDIKTAKCAADFLESLLVVVEDNLPPED